MGGEERAAFSLHNSRLPQVAPGTRCYSAALDTFATNASAGALLVHEDDVHCLPRGNATCGPSSGAAQLQCFFPTPWNHTTQPCASQFYTCAAGVPSQVRQWTGLAGIE